MKALLRNENKLTKIAKSLVFHLFWFVYSSEFDFSSLKLLSFTPTSSVSNISVAPPAGSTQCHIYAYIDKFC